jgi:PAS domain-containing protein
LTQTDYCDYPQQHVDREACQGLADSIDLDTAVKNHDNQYETPLTTVAQVAVESDRSGYLKRDPDYNQQAELTATVEDAIDEGRVDPRERFSTIIERPSGVGSVENRNGVYRYQSPSVRRVLGYDLGAFVGRRTFESVHPDDRQEARIDFFQPSTTPNGRSPSSTASNTQTTPVGWSSHE